MAALLDVVERDVEDQRRVGRNARSRAGVAVCKFGRNNQAALPADPHTDDALIPSSNHLSRSQAEGKIEVRVELRALGVRPARIMQPSRIGNSHKIARGRRRSGADHEIDLRIGGARGGWCRRCRWAIVAAAGGDNDQRQDWYEAFHFYVIAIVT